MVAACLLGGCQRSATQSKRIDTDSSRGLRLGQARLNERPALLTDRRGENTYVVWTGAEGNSEARSLRFVRLDDQGRIAQAHNLGIGDTRPSRPELARGGVGEMHLTWIDRSGDVRRLRHVRLDDTGSPVSEPTTLSLASVDVDSYAVAKNGLGGLDVLWSVREGQGPGLYHLRLDASGGTDVDNMSLRLNGFGPGIRLDRDGTVHMVWLEAPSFGERAVLYATLDPVDQLMSQPVVLGRYPQPVGVAGYAPCLGLTDGDVYVFWSLERRGGGMSPPEAETFVVTFPMGRPDRAKGPSPVNIPPTSRPRYLRVESAFGVSELAEHRGVGSPSTVIYQPAAGTGIEDELAVAFATQLQGRTKAVIQPVLTLWADGSMRGYQILAKTDHVSLRPSLHADESGDLHLAWIDTAGFGVYDVYHATTRTATTSLRARITGRDVLEGAMAIAWGVVQALSFVPLVLMWMLAPLMLLAVYVFLRPQVDLAFPLPRAVLALTILVYMAAKYLLRANWLAALPLPRDLPQWLGNGLTYAAPLAISGVAGLVASVFTRRRDLTSLLPTFFVFAACDALITLFVYIPAFLAE